MTSKILLAAVAAAVALPGVAQAQRAPAAVIVLVDTDRVYTECTACRAAVTQLQSKQQTAQARQTALAGPIRTEAQAIQTALTALGGKAPDAALQARIKAVQTREQAANTELQRLAQDLESTQMNVRRQIDAKLAPVISQVMTARGANVAVDLGSTLAASAGLNVTTEVLATLNQQLPSVSVTPMARPQQPASR